jgi:pimeloyl-ACP methyl ester carboxylesterase
MTGLLVRDHHVLPRVAGLGHAVAPDFFGFGDSEAIRGDPMETAGEESLAGGSSWSIRLLFGRVIMVGQDIGSRSLQRWRALAPERVHGLVLLNPTHPFIGNEGGSDD